MRPRIPALLLCSLVLTLPGCGGGDTDGASSEAASRMAAQDTTQAKQGKRVFDLSVQRCADWKGKKAPAGPTNEVVIGFSGGQVTASPKAGTNLIVHQGQPIVFESDYAFAVEVPGVDLDDPGQRRISVAKPASGMARADIRVKDDALCGSFKYTVGITVDGVPHVIDPEGFVWP